MLYPFVERIVNVNLAAHVQQIRFDQLAKSFIIESNKARVIAVRRIVLGLLVVFIVLLVAFIAKRLLLRVVRCGRVGVR